MKFKLNTMKKIVSLLSAVALFVSCTTNDGKMNNGDNFNRKQMLENWADNIIIPSFQNYSVKVNNLVTVTATFTASPNEGNLQLMRAAWYDAYKSYQQVALFELGKAEEINFRHFTNVYPTNKNGIDANIASGSYNLVLLSNFDKQGFPAFDYMINGLAADDTSIIAYYNTNGNSVNYKSYLIALANRLKQNADLIVSDWNNGYRNIYVNNNGSSVSSATNRTVNNFLKYFEKDVRAGKIGIPSGVFSNGTKFTDKVEAYYKNDKSKELLLIAVQASHDFFNGKKFNGTTNGESLKSYLDYLNVVRNGQNLSAIISNQFETIINASNVLNSSFSQQIFTDNSKMLTAYDALHQNVIYLKLDMMQALNINVDYVDSDGD
jgi:predicted lipoprotein